MDDGIPAPPFRLIAIVSSAAAARRVVETMASIDRGRPFGLMIRDPAHDEARVRAIVEEIAGEVPPSVHLIANATAVTQAERTHLPFERAGAVLPMTVMGYIVGASVHTIGEAASLDGLVEYLVASPVFPTPSKPGHPGIGLEGLRRLCTAVATPVFALGGIGANTARACLEAGAFGLAAITAFEDPLQTRALVDATDAISFRGSNL